MSRTTTFPVKCMQLLLLSALAFSASAQDPDEVSPELADERQESGDRPGEGAMAMSPAGTRELTLATSAELVSQSGNTVMTAGTCLVIDDLVRQFCAANPGDASCQYQ